MHVRRMAFLLFSFFLSSLLLDSCGNSKAVPMSSPAVSLKRDRVAMALPPPMPVPLSAMKENREKYAHLETNPVKRTAEEPVSTFSVDVDTGAYSNIRRFLTAGEMPPKDAVRIEEMINSFHYDYKGPKNRNEPFSVTTALSVAPWNKQKHLLQIGIKGYTVAKENRPAANLVFLVDVSGSMDDPKKIGLVKYALKEMVGNLNGKDRVSIVVYAGSTDVLLEPTPGNQKEKIKAAVERLRVGGTTDGGSGILLAYAQAEASFIKGGINRILIATDGDFNVGTTDFQRLVDMIEEKRKSGITFSSLGFGEGNYNDELMEQLADKGNGNYSYIDSAREARKALVEDMTSNLMVIAKDVKIQVEFNPEQVAEYRLIGYENRILKREDFNNDKIDAGEIGAGHTVTAFYEVVLTGDEKMIEPLRYEKKEAKRKKGTNEIAFLRLRYKQPEGDKSRLIEIPIMLSSLVPDLSKCSDDFRFAASVAAFGEMLRGGKYTGTFSYDDLLSLAGSALAHDEYGYKKEFVEMVKTARTLEVKPPTSSVGQ